MLVVMRGDIQHKDLWQIDLASGTERQLTSLPADVNVRDFDVSPDGREIVFEQVQEAVERRAHQPRTARLNARAHRRVACIY